MSKVLTPFPYNISIMHPFNIEGRDSPHSPSLQKQKIAPTAKCRRKRLNMSTKEKKKKVAAIYYGISVILFYIAFIAAGVFIIILACEGDLSLIVLGLVVSGLICYGSLRASRKIQHFLYRKGYIPKSRMIR